LFLNRRIEVWHRRGEAASTRLSAALYSVYSGLYSEAVVSSAVSAVALVDVGRFREAVEYLQKAAKALYEAAKEAFEKVKVSLQRLAELFAEAVARVLARVNEHKAYLFLMAAAVAGAVALSVAFNMWGLVELEKLAYAVFLTPFVTAGVREYPREEAFNILRSAPDPYEKFKEVAKAANAGKVKLAEPWESLRVLIMPRPSEERKLMWGGGVTLYSKYLEDEKYKRALFYATFALEETFRQYRQVAEGVKKEMRNVLKVEKISTVFGERTIYVVDVVRLRNLVREEEETFQKALETLKKRLLEFETKYPELRQLLNVEGLRAKELAETGRTALSKHGNVNFGVKAYAALLAYREFMFGVKTAYGVVAKHWLEGGKTPWLLYYTPHTAYYYAEKAGRGGITTNDEAVVEAFRRLFLKPGAERYSRFLDKVLEAARQRGGLALEPEPREESDKTWVFKVTGLEGVKLVVSKIGESASWSFVLMLDRRWREFFREELGAVERVATTLKRRWRSESPLPHMSGWLASDVSISRGEPSMSTSSFWQAVVTKALFGWSDAVRLELNLTLEGPKLAFLFRTSADVLNEAITRDAEKGWLKLLGIEARSWRELKHKVAEHWDMVVEAVKKRLKDVEVGSGFDLEKALEELEELASKLDDDKIAREVVAPALLLMQAERLGVDETTLRYFGAVLWGALGGDGYVSAAMKEVGLTSGEDSVALLWAAALAAYGVKSRARNAGSVFEVRIVNDDAVMLAQLYVLFGPPMLEEELIDHRLVEAVELGSKVSVTVDERSWRRVKDGAAVDLYISAGGVTRKFNLHLQEMVSLRFKSTDHEEVELRARLLRLAGVKVDVKMESNRNMWHIRATTDQLAEGNEELRRQLVKTVEEALRRGLIDEEKARLWIEKFNTGVSTWRGYKFGIRLSKGALQVKFRSTNPENVRKLKQELESLGLREDEHFTVKWPEDEKIGYISIATEGITRLAYIAKYGTDEAQRLGAASLIEHLSRKAELASKEVSAKLEELIREGESRRSLRAEGLKTVVKIEWKGRRVEVPVEVKNIRAWEEGDKLRIAVIAVVDGIKGEWIATFYRDDDNRILGYTVAHADAPGGKEEDAKRATALTKALTGEEPNIIRKEGRAVIRYTRRHLEGFKKYAEVADAIEEWEKDKKQTTSSQSKF
jgi:tetratricopeptide (TPR) repeat protein